MSQRNNPVDLDPSDYQFGHTYNYVFHLLCSDDGGYEYSIDMSKWFCFTQSTTGKIVGVFYPKNEKEDVINLKKSIAPSFQANLRELLRKKRKIPSLFIAHITGM